MTGKTKGGVSVMLAGQSQRFKGAFIAELKSGHVGIFERTGVWHRVKNKKTGKMDLREIVTELTTSAVPGMAASEKTQIPDKIAPMIQEEFENHFKREAEAWLGLLGAK